jgi:hypothetical protein
MSDCTTSTRFFHLLIAPLEPILPKAIREYDTDYGIHKFGTVHHVQLSIFGQLEQIKSGRALVEELNDLDGVGHERNLREMIGFDEVEFGQPVTLNQSSFSRANQERDYRVWRSCFHQLWALAKKQVHHRELEGLGKIILVDGSLFDCMHQMFWAIYSSTKTKIKGHFFYDLDGLPEKLVLTVGTGNEREVLRQALKAWVTYIVDRGYNDYQLYRDIIDKHAHIVTRVIKNAEVKVLKEYEVSAEQARKGIIADQKVELGSGTNTVVLRLVTYQGQGKTDQDREWCYLTTRYDLAPYTIVELYMYRWQIELFFKWIKSHLQLKHWYSYDKNGVLIQLYTALITFLLLKLYSALLGKTEYQAMRIDFMRWMRRHLFDQRSEAEIVAYLDLLAKLTRELRL